MARILIRSQARVRNLRGATRCANALRIRRAPTPRPVPIPHRGGVPAPVDPVEAGIVDPTQAVRIALDNAASVSSVRLAAAMPGPPEPHDRQYEGESPPEVP